MTPGPRSRICNRNEDAENLDWIAFRTTASPNTYAVAVRTLQDPFDGGQKSVGVDLDDVRVLSTPQIRLIAEWRRFRERRRYKAMFRR